MNLRQTTAFFAVAMVGTGIFLGTFNQDFLFGIITGSGVWLGITSTLGFWLNSKHIERMDKLQRDHYEDVLQHSEEVVNPDKNKP